ncbi:MAG TPA: alpha/beta hydrolase-fold protein [Caulobacteraceae bacterium]|nr:alpha/beta hydrolase-fold protein [Caulobacteraceae bacterium]
MDTKTYESLGLHMSLSDVDPARVVNGRSNREIRQALATEGDRQYHPCPEAVIADGVARGRVASHPGWAQSRMFPGTERDLWIYTPAGFDPRAAPPALIVFNDGGGYLDRDGPVRAAAVLDSLIHNGEAPPTIGVFVMPGRAESSPAQRSLEYDSVTDAYVRFLLEDLLPFVEAEIGCALTADPAHRTICGISSGGICAFTAAWYRPDAFGRVLSHCGSFTAIRGGHNYPFLIRSTPRKPIRVFMQSGENDADIIFGSWPMANKEVAAALTFAGYEVKFVFGEGGHNLRHGGALFADSLRWLWAAETD